MSQNFLVHFYSNKKILLISSFSRSGIFDKPGIPPFSIEVEKVRLLKCMTEPDWNKNLKKWRFRLANLKNVIGKLTPLQLYSMINWI